MLVYLVKLCSYTSLTLLVPPDSETTTLKRMDVTTKKPASLPPYVINTGENQDITPKFSKYSTRNPHLSFLSNLHPTNPLTFFTLSKLQWIHKKDMVIHANGIFLCLRICFKHHILS